MKRLVVTTAGAAMIAAFAAAPGRAADWQIGPRLALGYYYTDNFLLDLPSRKLEVDGGELDALLDIRAKTPRTDFGAKPRVRATYFPDNSDEDSTDLFLDFDLLHRGERFEFGGTARFADESVSRSGIAAAEAPTGGGSLGEGSNVDSGSVRGRDDRRLYEINPRALFEWSQRTSLELTGNFQDVAYGEGFVDLVDYRDYRLGFGGRYALNERRDLRARLVVGGYRPDIGPSDADIAGAEFELRNRPTSTSEFYVRAGVTRTDLVDDEVTSFVGGAGGRWTFERSDLYLDLIRNVEPNAGGFVVNRNELQLYYNYRFSPRVTAFAGAIGISEDRVTDAGGEQRDYATARLGLEWRIRRTWALNAAADYAWQDIDTDPTSSSGTTLRLSVVYEPRRLP